MCGIPSTFMYVPSMDGFEVGDRADHAEYCRRGACLGIGAFRGVWCFKVIEGVDASYKGGGKDARAWACSWVVESRCPLMDPAFHHLPSRAAVERHTGEIMCVKSHGRIKIKRDLFSCLRQAGGEGGTGGMRGRKIAWATLMLTPSSSTRREIIGMLPSADADQRSSSCVRPL